ncbi:MAG: hypothetical protein Kow0029_31070 [Candidatus Rifleibacteriota bacterium]
MPEKLDLNDWIQFCLNSEEELDRQIALEEFVTTGVPPYLAAKLREMSARDISSVCRQLASWVCSIESARSELKPLIRKLDLSPQSILNFLENAEPAMAFVLTQMLRKSPGEEILKLWREALKVENPTRIIQIGLTILGKFGCIQDCEIALKFLSHNDPEIVCAALSLLQLQSPEIFKQNIRLGLSSKYFKIQMHSVHLLRAIDPEETVKYIQAFLFHKNPLVRQKALRELMLLPFDKVENLFLQFLSREKHPLLLVKAGFVVAFNPLPDFPLKVFDIFQFSKDSKKHILQLILKQLVESVQKAGILKQTIEEYARELKQKISFRRSELIIRCAVKDLTSPDKNMRLSAVDRLLPYAEYPSIKQALLKHLDAETNAEVRGAIEQIITSQETPVVVKPGFPASANSFLELGIKEQKQLLKNIRTDKDWHNSRSVICELLEENVKRNVLLEILKVVQRFGSRIDSPKLLGLLEREDPSVLAATIKTIGTIDIDVMLPHLNRFLADDDPRIKSAALEVYIQADKEGAVQYLSSMLRSTAPATRRVGLSLLPQIDYSSAEPLLWNLLKYEANMELKIQAGYMVAANPTREGLFKLFALTHKKNGELIADFEELWGLALVSAEAFFNRSREDIEADCWEAFKADEDRVREDKSSYSYSSIIGDESYYDNEAGNEQLTLIEQIFLHFSEFRWHYVIGITIIVPMIILLWPEQKKTASGRYKSRTAKMPGANFVSSKPTSNTQVGSEDWKGTLKSGARELLNGAAYKNVLNSSVREIQEVRANYEKDRRQYYIELANNQNEPEEVRALAEAQLNSAFAEGFQAWDNGNIAVAELCFERAVEDPQLNGIGKCFALQKLAQIAEGRKDKVSWLKWQDRLLKELRKMPGYENIKGFDEFAKNYVKMVEVSHYLANGGESSPMVDFLKSIGESDESARKGIEDLKNIDKFMDLNKGSRTY